MATIPTRSFNSFVELITSGMQGRTAKILNFAIGKVFRSFAEAYAGVGLYQQSQTLSVLAQSRLSTSFGPDADSWVADFGIIQRIGAVAATTTVVYSRNTPSGSSPVILIGSVVKTTDGTQSFAVYADTSNPSYNPTAGGTSSAPVPGYVMPPQVASLLVPVVSTTPLDPTDPNSRPGSNGNVAAASISLVSSPAPFGVDNVTNPSPVTNGSDAELDPAFKERFRDAIAALSKATIPAIIFACKSVQQNLQVRILNNSNLDGSFNPGMVSIVVDDGSGEISDQLLSQVTAMIRKYRAAGIRTGVYRAKTLPVLVQLTISVLPGYSRQNVVAVVSSTIKNNINGLGLSNGEVDYFTVGKWALQVPGVEKISGLSLNKETANIIPSAAYTTKCSGVIIN